MLASLIASFLAATGPQGAPVPGAPPAGPAQPAATMVVEPVAMAIAAFDADRDGVVTRVELEAGVARSFAAIDTANAGRLGYISYGDWAKRWLGDANALPSPLTVDSDNDDRITLPELQAQFAKLFARFDRDGDARVTRAELLTIRAFAEGDGRRGRGDRQQDERRRR